MSLRRGLPAVIAATGLVAAGAFAWLRDEAPPAADGGVRSSAPAPSRSVAEREADDILEAVAAGRFSAALNGIVSFLASHGVEVLGGGRREPFREARLVAGRWGLSEAADLAAGGEEEGAAALLRKAAIALQGIAEEGEVASAEARVRELLEEFRREAEDRRREEALAPAEKAIAAARARAAGGEAPKALADLRGVLKATTDPAARRLVEGEIAGLQKTLSASRARTGRRKQADAALARGDYKGARRILEDLVEGAGEDEAGKAEAAKDAERIEGLKDLEENREPETLAAVRRALRWMVRQQLTDGSFCLPTVDAQGTKLTEDQRKRGKYRTGITGLAALALLGHVRHDLTDEFEPALDRTLAWILSHQGKDGSFSRNLYEHSLCTLALVDADRLLHRTEVRDPARRAIAWLQEAMNSDGGWRYSPRSPPSDVSATGWALQALLHASLGSYEVKPEVIDLAFSYLDRMTDPDTGKTGYVSPGQGSLAMTAVTLFCRLRHGMGPADEPVERAADLLLRTLPREGWGQSSYHLFYASDAMSRLGGKWWKGWAPSLKTYLLKTQVAKGDDEGAWPTAMDRWARDAGAVYLAAIHSLCLENFFEHRE